MRVRLVRRPGQHGTREYVETYGDRLICVRYRYDAAARRRYKTIEIIVDEAPWAPPAGEPQAGLPGGTTGAAGEGPGSEPSVQPRAELPLHAMAQPATPSLPAESYPPATAQPPAPATLVGVRLPRNRPQLIAKVQQGGGEYRSLLNVWAVRYDRAVALGLAEFIVDSVERLVAAWNSQSSRRSSRS